MNSLARFRRLRIFLGYRRDDTSGYAGRLRADLEKRLWGSRIFMDIHAIQPGEEFPHVIEKYIPSCHLFLALIGKEWLTLLRTYEADPGKEDYTRLEIKSAYDHKVPLIPVLVDHAAMPGSKELPDDLQFLARRQAHELTDLRWDYDVDRLAQAILLGARRPQQEKRPALLRAFAVVVLLLCLAALLSMKLWPYRTKGSRTLTDPGADVVTQKDSGGPINRDKGAAADLAAGRSMSDSTLHPQYRINKSEFLDQYQVVTRSVLNERQVFALGKLIDAINADTSIKDVRWAAYILATVHHESVETFRPYEEPGDLSYFEKYEPGTSTGRNLGNTQKGDGYRFRGRGYVQITGRENYRRMTARLKLPSEDDLERDPDVVLRPEIAYRILSLGMLDGTFTGKRLDNYLNHSKTDYTNARRIINAMDKAGTIAEQARFFESALRWALQPSSQPQ